MWCCKTQKYPLLSWSCWRISVSSASTSSLVAMRSKIRFAIDDSKLPARKKMRLSVARLMATPLRVIRSACCVTGIKSVPLTQVNFRDSPLQYPTCVGRLNRPLRSPSFNPTATVHYCFTNLGTKHTFWPQLLGLRPDYLIDQCRIGISLLALPNKPLGFPRSNHAYNVFPIHCPDCRWLPHWLQPNR